MCNFRLKITLSVSKAHWLSKILMTADTLWLTAWGSPLKPVVDKWSQIKRISSFKKLRKSFFSIFNSNIFYFQYSSRVSLCSNTSKVLTNLGLGDRSCIVKRQITCISYIWCCWHCFKWCRIIFLKSMERKSNTKKIGNILHLHYHWYRFKTATFNIQGQQQPSSINCVMLGHVKQVCNTWQNFPLLCNQKVTSRKLWICLVITWSTLLIKKDGGNFWIC